MAAPESTALITQSTMTAVLKLPTASISTWNVSSKTSIGIATTASVLPCSPKMWIVWLTPLKKSKSSTTNSITPTLPKDRMSATPKSGTQNETAPPKICLSARKPALKKASISLEHWKATLPRKSFFKSPQNSWTSSMSALASTFTFWIGRYIWMRERRTSTNGMCSIARTNTAKSRPSKKRRWKHLALNCQSRTSPLAVITTARSHSMQPAARCYSRLPNATAWNWTKCRNTADGLIWKSGTISWQSKKNNLLNRKKPYRNRPLSLKI